MPIRKIGIGLDTIPAPIVFPQEAIEIAKALSVDACGSHRFVARLFVNQLTQGDPAAVDTMLDQLPLPYEDRKIPAEVREAIMDQAGEEAVKDFERTMAQVNRLHDLVNSVLLTPPGE